MAERALPTEKFREDHSHILNSIARFRDAMGLLAGEPGSEVTTEVGEIVEFINRTLIPHLQWEREVFLPTATDLLGEHREFQAEPDIDYPRLNGTIEALLAELDAIHQRGPVPADFQRLREVSDELGTILAVHFQRIDLYLDALDQYAGREGLEALIFSAKQAGIH